MSNFITLQDVERRARQTNAALALLASKEKQTLTTQIVEVETTVETLTPPLANEERTLYVDMANGSDTNDDPTKLGKLNAPYKTIQAALDKFGQPTSQTDFETPVQLIVKGKGFKTDPGSSGSGVIRIPTRRIRIDLQAGLCVRNQFQCMYSNTARGGSARAAEIAFSCPGGVLDDSTTVVNIPQAGCAHIGDGTNALNLDSDANPAAARPVRILMQGIVVDGAVTHDNFFLAGDISLTLIDVAMAIGRWGPNVVGDPGLMTLSRAARLLQNTGCNWKGNLVARIDDSVLGGDWDVATTPALYANRAGIRNSFVAAGTTWTGPNVSCYLDATTNYWVKTNALAGWGAADKVILNDAVA